MVFCIPRWLRENLSETPTVQRAIKGAFNARVNAWPLDYINEPNLRTYRLALVDDDEPSSTPTAFNPTIVMSFVPLAKSVVALVSASTKFTLAS